MAGGVSVVEPGNGSPGCRVVVSMHDSMAYAFEPELSSPRQCETIEFIVTNNGAIQHEFSIGNADQMKHTEIMRNMPNMDHQDPSTVSLVAGGRLGSRGDLREMMRSYSPAISLDTSRPA